MPKHTLHTAKRRFVVAAERTIKNTIAANVPKESGRLVTRIKMGPRFFNACSLAASEAEVDDAGYPPPVPNPTMPPETVIMQNIPLIVMP